MSAGTNHPVDIERIREDVNGIAVVRTVGSPGHAAVRQMIVGQIEALNAAASARAGELFERLWTVELDEFTDSTPHGPKIFANIIATLNPHNNQDERIVFAAHYDSKHFADAAFVGATDSAVPCALLLDIARFLSELYFSLRFDFPFRFSNLLAFFFEVMQMQPNCGTNQV
ncbi:MAG: M28 family peptidase [archaeon]|nr:M28 family peptidase [archaeon]